MRTALVIVALACGALLVLLRPGGPAPVEPASSPGTGSSLAARATTDLEATPPTSIEAGSERETTERVSAPSPGAAGDSEDATSEPKPSTGAVHVQVVDDLGRPVTVGSVVLQRLGRDWHARAVDEEGWARFEAVETGRFEVAVQLLPPELLAPPRSVVVDVEENHAVEARFECVRPGSLRVRVGGADGAAMSGAEVRLVAPNHGPRVEPRTTDALGEASFMRLHPGDYSVVTRLAPEAEGVAPAPSNAVVAAGQTLEHHVTLERTGLAVRVLVRDRLARGVEQIPVALYSQPDGPEPVVELARKRSDERGFVTFDDCPRARLRVTVPLVGRSVRPWGADWGAMLREAPESIDIDLRTATASPARQVIEVDLDPTSRRLRIDLDRSNVQPRLRDFRLWSSIQVVPSIDSGRPESRMSLMLPSASDGFFYLTVDESVTRLTIRSPGGGGGGYGFSFSAPFSETVDLSHLPADGRTLSTLKITPPAPKIVERGASDR